ncbi:insecticidal toxin complex protein [Coniochaeta sp. 2T2.1]|nr:insecticidal toxin complex protein [Coniochaeta sp. 2T2.1]
MAPTYFLVRIIPTKVVSPTTFQAALQNITITAYDKTVNTAGIDRSLGTATGLAPGPDLSHPPPNPVPPLVILNNPLRLQASIIQHLRPLTLQPLSVATAVIVVDPAQVGTNLEYPTSSSFDVRLELTQAGTSKAFVRDPVVDYNITAVTEDLSIVQSDYMHAQTDIYLTLDVPELPLPAGTALISPNRDGHPPNYDILRDAINKVLAKDVTAGAPDLEHMTAFLSTEQARQVAAELVYNRTIEPAPEAPFPTADLGAAAPDTLFEDMYTMGATTNSDKLDKLDKARQKFQGERTSYYALHGADSIQLANFVFSVVMAVRIERYTREEAASAVLDVPVKPSNSHMSSKSSTTISLTGSVAAPGNPPAPLAPAVIIPAAFIYALTTAHTITQDFDARIQVLLTMPSGSLNNIMRQAIDMGVLNSPDPDGFVSEHTTLVASGGVTINQYQAIRRLAALQPFSHSASDNLVEPARNADVRSMMSKWLDFSKTDDKLATFWEGLYSTREYLVTLLEIVTPRDSKKEDLVVEILHSLMTSGGTVIATVDDLLHVTEDSWFAFFQAHLDLMPKKYLLGDLRARVHSFVQDISKILFLSPTSLPPPTFTASEIPTLQGDFDSDVLLQFFGSFSAFSLSDTFDAAKRQEVYDAALVMSSGNTDIAAFVAVAVEELWTLYRLTDFAVTMSPKMRFSYMEALHARGLTTAAKILEIPQNSFPNALVGTVAFPRAEDIYALAKNLPWTPDDDDSPPMGGFQPINGGRLVDCIPPCHLSPFGVVQYLHDLLSQEDSGGEQTVGDVLTSRRGDFGSLKVTSANVDLPLPRLDMVNEALEAFGMRLTEEAPAGVMFNTLDQGLKDLDIPGVDALQVADSLTALGILRAMPQHSTPHPLDTPNIYDVLKTSFGRPDLPYSQGLDISRTYLKELGSSRFETMRTFQKNITELPQDASLEPEAFQKSLWRFPVRHDIALEYLCISSEEAALVFGGQMSTQTALEILGFRNRERLPSADNVTSVSWFLKATGITYCEFLELHDSGIVPFNYSGEEGEGFPDCLPCCPGTLRMSFDSEAVFGEVMKLAIFISLWRKLKGQCQKCLPMATLADICAVFGLFNESNVNADFPTQLSSLLMLKDIWNLPWTNPKDHTVSTHPDRRTPLLALWSGAGETTRQYRWAVEALLHGVERHSMATYQCPKRSASWRKIIAENLESLASLAGFGTAPYAWNSKPTCTIRFAEVLSKLHASNFTVGEVLYLFTTKDHLRGDDPYPATEADESLDDPLNVPEDDEAHGLWALRHKLLRVDVCEEEASRWTWARIETALHELGYTRQHNQFGDIMTYFGERFFPEILEQEGRGVPRESRRFEVDIDSQQTSPQVWAAAGDCSPFHLETPYDERPGVLWVKLPLRDDDVLRALRDMRQLNYAEREAVQTLFLEPRAAVVPFAQIFANFDRATEYMVQEPCVHKRFAFFQCEFAGFVKRCRVIAHHVHDTVSAVAKIDRAECSCATTGEECECAGAKVAWQILKRLIADENRANNPWENPDDSGGAPQAFDFQPFVGSAFAALLGLTGTGLLGEYQGLESGASWVETRGGMSGWGGPRNYWNSPVATVIPSIGLTATPEQSLLASFKNGFAFNQESGHVISGGEPFTVSWTGVLLIECNGCYHFVMSCPKHAGDDGGDGACGCEKEKQWSVTISRGQKTWSLINKGIDDDAPAPASYSKSVPLRRGAYDIAITFRQLEPDVDDEDDLHRFHTGFILRYTGPDTEHCLNEVPMKSLYIKYKNGPLGSRPDTVAAQLQGLLDGRYISTLNDIRRTYQRAFKAVLFAQRFCLSACRSACEWQSELGYLLSHPDKFQGTSYYFDAAFHAHAANFDFNFLPVSDAYFPPDRDVDQRVAPSWKRTAAMFDWFERIFDYARLRKWVRAVCERPVWLVFFHSDSDSPQPVSQLVRYLDVEIALAQLVLEYFEAGGVWKLSDANDVQLLTDERWVTRVWLAGRYVHRLRQHFYAPTSELTYCRPALWASSPNANVVIEGTTGNQNLTRFVERVCLSKTDAPPRLSLVITLNDALRLHARSALLSWADFEGYPSRYLGDTLLIDVEAGIDETTTRLDDAVATAQRFMQRVVLGLEADYFSASDALLKRWECELSSFDRWQAAQRRKWYAENWVQWEEAGKLEVCEGFQSLKKFLGAGVSTLALPERNLYWQDEGKDLPPSGAMQISSAQKFGLSERRQAADEGLRLLGTPDHSGRPTWLASLPALAREFPGDGGGRREAHELTNSIGPTHDAKAAQVIVPGSASLDHIPLWIQSAVRLGARFLRIAASGLPIASAYTSKTKPAFCCQCQKDHPPVIDEYYFWLEDARRYEPVDAPAPQNADQHSTTPGIEQPLEGSAPQIDPRTREADPTSDWDVPTPQMLSWRSRPLVHLRWTRVHMGLLLDPRRSTEGIPLMETQLEDVEFEYGGRGFDSLFFSVIGATTDDSSYGFRYDIASDSAVVLPEAVPSPDPSPLPLPSSLSSFAAFPYFLYFAPGSPLTPVGTFSPSLVIANSLRSNCKYETASNWLRLEYDALGRDNSWMLCQSRGVPGGGVSGPVEGPSLTTTKGKPGEKDKHKTKVHDITLPRDDKNLFAIILKVGDGNVREGAAADGAANPAAATRLRPDFPCCPTSPVKGARARSRAAVLEYLENLLEWSNTLRCRNSLEASQQALTLLGVMEQVLGPKPAGVNASDNTQGEMTVSEFEAYSAPLNPRLVELYDRVGESTSELRSVLSRSWLRNGEIGRDFARFGSHKRWDANLVDILAQPTGCESSCCFSCCQPYRFASILPKAMSWTALAKSTAAAMLSALEKTDTEALSSLRLAQERQMTELGLEISKNGYRAADWDVQALDKQMANAVTRLQYFQGLIEHGLIAGEVAHTVTTGASMASRTSATIVDGIGQGMASVPDMWIGIAGTMGTPLQFSQMPMGVKMGTGFAAAARILNTVADISNSAAGLSLTQSGWDRREDEWQHTCDTTVIDIQQIKRQRLAARRRLDTALRELNNLQRRIEHSAEVQDFSRDKTSRYELYLYLQQENAALYRQCYEMALRTAQETEQALRYELGDIGLSFIPPAIGSWDSLHEGLLAGEKLEFALSEMERAHMSKHCREYELTKHISLRLHCPAAFVLLKSTGYCELDLPEWLFDLDYPGHYMRRIRSVSLTIPCVAGPYTGVHCKLQQLSSVIRFRPLRTDRDTCKCCPQTKKKKETTTPSAYMCPKDPNIWTRYAGTEAIATSAGQNDSGLFELNFNDPRYLPFEYTGAVSRWRIELPLENNQFDFDSLSDLVMHVNFTAREGGTAFAKQSNAIAQRHVPGDGIRFIDIRHEMPEAWNVVRKDFVCEACQHGEKDGFCCGEESGRCRCGKERKHHHHVHEARVDGSKKDDSGWCENCKKNHKEDERRCRSSHEGHWDDDKMEPRKEGNHKPGSKRRLAHLKREVHLNLARNRFPFLTGRRGVTVTSFHLLFATKGCGVTTAKVRFTPPHHPGQEACIDTDEIPLVPTEGGMLKGSLILKHPVDLEDRGCEPRAKGESSVGTLSLPCELKGICGAWLLYGYRSTEKESCDKVAVVCCTSTY